MTTLAQYRSAVASNVGLDNTVAGDQGFIDIWVNEGVTDLMMRTKCKMSSADMALTAGTPDYTLDAAVLDIYTAYVTVSGVPYWLEVTSVDDILAMRRSTTANVSPAQYYAFGGSNMFLIYPTPATADTITIYYLPRPATMTAASASPDEIPSEFHPAIEYYALMRAASFADDASAQEGQAYQQQYEMWVKRIKRWVGLKGNHRLPRAGVRRNRNTIPFHDRSRYPNY
jgi:hypothetical protein